MNKKMVFSVLDRVAGEYGPLFVATNKDVAMRLYRRLLRDESVVELQEYSLIHVGDFDSETGKLIQIETNEEVE